MNQIGDGKWLELLEGIVKYVEKICFIVLAIYATISSLFTVYQQNYLQKNRPCVELRLKLSYSQ